MSMASSSRGSLGASKRMAGHEAQKSRKGSEPTGTMPNGKLIAM